MSGLFAKPSVIDNEKIVAEKTRTIVQLKKKERKEKRRQEKNAPVEEEVEAEEENADSKPVDGDAMDIDSDEEKEENPDLESKYMSKLVDEDEDEESEEEDGDEDEEENDEKSDDKSDEKTEDGEMDVDAETITERETTDSKVGGAAKILDLKDKEFEKAERTIFIGNVPAIIMSNKRETKDFKLFINKFLNCPEHTSLIDSIRFRSIHSTTTAPRKVAFISKEVDLENVMNSYVVFKNKEDSLKALKLNGQVYKDHHLRVDHLTHPNKKDNKLSIFVGNLDFQEKEETLWKYFNKKCISNSERDTGLKNVIDNVRIIRDSKTSYGKGFAIVQFIDSNYVTKALLLDDKKMNNKRTLRITRCKKTMRNNETMRSKFSKLNDKQKTVVGRAKQLGKTDRRTLGKLVVEGERATKGKTPIGKGGKVDKKRHGGRKERREKDAKITSRSKAFREKLEAEAAAKPGGKGKPVNNKDGSKPNGSKPNGSKPRGSSGKAKK